MRRSSRAAWTTSAALAALFIACTPAKPQSAERGASNEVDAASDAALADTGVARSTFAPKPSASVAQAVDAGPPPARPTSLVAKAVSPFAVRLTWEATRPGSGFEVQIRRGEAFLRAALVDPTKREFVHHLRLPGQVVTYRVRAFDTQGPSEPSPLATLIMPEKPDPTASAPVAIMPCTPLPSKPPKSSGCDPDISKLDAGDGHVVFNVPGAGDGCKRHLMGEYAGCMRELGVFTLQANVVIVKGKSDDGWPLLHAIAGAGQEDGAQIQTLRFSRGRYAVADEAHVCGERGAGSPAEPDAGLVSDDLERCSPPFETCQRDPTPL